MVILRNQCISYNDLTITFAIGMTLYIDYILKFHNMVSANSLEIKHVMMMILPK